MGTWRGSRIVAVDISPSMLAILDSRIAEQPAEVGWRIQIVESDVCELALGAQYDLVMVPFYIFNYLLTEEAQNAALDGFIRMCLRRDGYS